MLSKIIIKDNNVELIKYIALLCMVMDHVNKYLLNYSIPYFFEMGRLAMPLFGFILAYNLSRESYYNNPEKLKKTFIKLLLFGVIATPFYILLGGVKFGFWPLNILYTFAVSVVIIYVIEARQNIKYWSLTLALTFSIGGSLVEYWHPAVLLVVSAWWYFKTPNFYALVGIIISLIGLSLINGNAYAALSIPLLLVLNLKDIPFFRLQNFFYWFYPIHLIALLLIRIPMANAGYLFFI